MSWIGWIVIGALAGMIAKAIMKEEGGFFKNLILGIFGAVLGGWLLSPTESRRGYDDRHDLLRRLHDHGPLLRRERIQRT